MKKISIALVAIMLGIVANAASVNWSVNAIQSSPANTVGAGWIVQVYESSVTFDYEKAKAGEISAWVEGASVRLELAQWTTAHQRPYMRLCMMRLRLQTPSIISCLTR